MPLPARFCASTLPPKAESEITNRPLEGLPFQVGGFVRRPGLVTVHPASSTGAPTSWISHPALVRPLSPSSPSKSSKKSLSPTTSTWHSREGFRHPEALLFRESS